MRTQLLRAGFALMTLLEGGLVWSCDHCRPLVKSGVYNADFIETFSLLLLPLLALLALGIGAHYIDRNGDTADTNGTKRRRLW